MIEGTQTFTQAVSNQLKTIISMFVDGAVDMAAKWAAQQLLMTTQTVVSQTAQVSAVAAGTAAKTSTIIAGEATGLAVKKAASLATINTDAQQAMAGAYAAVSSIPLIGPFLAPAAALAAGAAVHGFSSFDTGAWNLKSDQLAYLHAGESVIPAKGGLAEEFRNWGEGAAKQPPNVTVPINITAMDSKSVKQFFSDNAHHVAAAMNSAVTRGSTLQMSRLSSR
jgi:hypothetical protein